MTARRHFQRKSHRDFMQQLDELAPSSVPEDTVPTFFPSIDKLLDGGFRTRALTVLGGDVGSGKSALALAISIRAARSGYDVAYVSGEMHEDRLVERAIAIESRTSVEELRSGSLSEAVRANVGATALGLDELPLSVFPIVGDSFDDVFAGALAANPALMIVDYLQLLPPPSRHEQHTEDMADTLRSLKALVLREPVACLLISQLPDFDPRRDDPRPTLEDFGTMGLIKQHADVVMSIYREEMYGPKIGIQGATELMVTKNRHGARGYVDLYYYQKWMRFEDVLDPEPGRSVG